MKSSGINLRSPVFGKGQSKSKPQEDIVTQVEIPMTCKDVSRMITWKEIRARDHDRPWFVVKGNVYDGTPFLKEHPGGPDSILLAASDDATEDFIAIHSSEGRAKLAEVSSWTTSTTNSTAHTKSQVSYRNPCQLRGRSFKRSSACCTGGRSCGSEAVPA